MKGKKSRVEKKVAKSAAKKQLEKSLSEKFFEVVKHLGHDAEKIGDDIAKASKVVAKKLSTKFLEVKEAVNQKLEEAAKANKPLKRKQRKRLNL
ncbi:hypothetical protein AQ505_19195 [Pedobacter sp. PACM 27299]|uniref:hypothetical protein n=1 Tax=Pedobacter sp. PACM 27299 TaxID=1727164 RepID=UPI0007059F13|nr:hypothetical protein [Pedobacter sp. PACM 27299]ALL07428.1 hypothetical protein AQ505_19195 [Pedobacter sp. PACM 27299]